MHLVGFIIRIFHDAWSLKRQIWQHFVGFAIISLLLGCGIAAKEKKYRAIYNVTRVQ